MEDNQTPKKRNYERYLEGETWSPSTGYEQNDTSASSIGYELNATSASSTGYELETANTSSFREADSPYYIPEETQTSYSYESSQNGNSLQRNYQMQTGYASAPGSSPACSGYEGLEEPVSMGEWALCIFLNCIPCVGLIMMFVWAFSKDTKKSKANFFKVQLIFMGIILGLYLLLFILLAVFGVALL